MSVLANHTSISHIVRNAVIGWEKAYIKRCTTTSISFDYPKLQSTFPLNAWCNLLGEPIPEDARNDFTERSFLCPDRPRNILTYEIAIYQLMKGEYSSFLKWLRITELPFDWDIHTEFANYIRYNETWSISEPHLHDFGYIKLRNFSLELDHKTFLKKQYEN